MATTIYVDDDCSLIQNGTKSKPFCTIQQGIDATVSGDSVSVATGTYTGFGNKNLTWTGKDIKVFGAGVSRTLISLDDSGRAFALTDPSVTTRSSVSDFAISGGDVTGEDVKNGGAILVSNAGLTVRDCAIRRCTADNGGAVAVEFGGTIVIHGSTIRQNTATFHGGGIYVNNSNADIMTSSITLSTAEGGSGGGIAFLSNDGVINSQTITDTTIADNTVSNGNAGDGGGGVSFIVTGLDPAVDTMKINRCTIQGNDAVAQAGPLGGGVLFKRACQGEPTSSTTGIVLTIENSFIVENTATVPSIPPPCTLCSARGGGIFVDLCVLTGETVSICNNTIADNSVGGGGSAKQDEGGGLFAFEVDDLVVHDTIFWNNTAPDGGNQIAMVNGTLDIAFTDAGGTDGVCPLEDDTNVLLEFAAMETCCAGEPNTCNTNLDPEFVTTAGDFHLESDSQLKDLGSEFGCGLFDIDLEDRVSGERVDIGADEIQQSP